MLPTIRKSGTAALLAVTMAAAAAAVAIFYAAEATAQTAPAPAPPVITATAAPLVRMQCVSPSTNTFSFQPYLTLVNQPTTIQRTTAYRKCNSPAVPNIRSGYNSITFNLNDDCNLMVASGGTSGFTITWNTTQTTTFTASRTTSLVGNVFTTSYNGTVTAGLFTGSSVRQTFTADATELNQCLAGTGVVPFLISDVVLTIF